MSTAVVSAVRSTTYQEPVQLQRTVRALIGWMRPADAKGMLAGPGAQPTPEHDEIVARASAVSQVADGCDQIGALVPAPAGLESTLRAPRIPRAQPTAEGWRVAVADSFKCPDSYRLGNTLPRS